MTPSADADLTTWGRAETRHVQLGDRRCSVRVAAMLARMSEQPCGRISGTFATSAERQAAYGIVENPRFSHQQLARSSHIETALRIGAATEVIVAIDGTGLAVAHRGASFGPISGKGTHGGAHAMTAYAVTVTGVPVGLIAQEFWTRKKAHSPVYAKDLRPIEDRETGHWLRTITATCATLARYASHVRPWFVVDRGGDCAAVIDCAMQLPASLTARACYDRNVRGGKLWDQAARAPLLGTYQLNVNPAGKRRRIATIQVRARPVEMRLALGPLQRGEVRRPTLWVVEAREIGRRREPILWRLLTTKPADTLVRARLVISTYARRWRVEEFHRAWKTGACDIENSFLRKPEHFYKWATLAAIVAARLERLKFLARAEPARPALDEYTRDEIDAAILLRRPKGVRRGATPTLGEMTRWVADLGGYVGKSSGGPPGTVVLRRGWMKIMPVVQALVNLRNDRENCDE